MAWPSRYYESLAYHPLGVLGQVVTIRSPSALSTAPDSAVKAGSRS